MLAKFRRASVAISLAGISAVSFAVVHAAVAPSVTLAELATGKSLGQRSAPITIEDFADFQCPTCKVLFQETTRKLIQDYVSTGKVYLVHHDYPLHPHSREAARWANAAAALGEFEPAEDALYAHQEDWGATGNIEGTLASVLSATQMKRAKLLINDPVIDQAVRNDIAMGDQRGVHSTPTVFVTHKGQTAGLPPGAISYPLLKQYLDFLLKQ